MARPKGSKNKSKEEVLVEAAAKVADGIVKEVILKEEPKAKQVGHPIAVVESYQPTPDMGKVKEPEHSGKCNACPHEKKQHFNGTSWCSQHGCPCGQYK